MRQNWAFTLLASALPSSVLPTPGTSSSSTCSPASKATTHIRTISALPSTTPEMFDSNSATKASSSGAIATSAFRFMELADLTDPAAERSALGERLFTPFILDVPRPAVQLPLPVGPQLGIHNAALGPAGLIQVGHAAGRQGSHRLQRFLVQPAHVRTDQ